MKARQYAKSLAPNDARLEKFIYDAYMEGWNDAQPKPVKLDFVAPEFEPVFMEWLDYKRERREKYKSPKSMKLAYEKLIKLSNNNPSVAAEVINQSMANNWAGLFNLKNETNRTNRFESDTTRRTIESITRRIEQTG